METNSVKENRNWLYLLAGAIFLIYLPVLIDLVINWYNDANYSHGFLVPLISGYLLWRRRKELAEAPLSSNSLGLILVIGSIMLFVVGNAASEYFTVRFSLILALFGIVLYLFGNEIVKKSWFEIVFLVFMIPVPYVVYFSATFPMQLLASKVTAGLLDILGMPVVRQGNIIHLPNESLEVAEACSGLRSLISLLALGAIYAHMTQKKLWAKVVLFGSTVPIAVLGNVFRVFVTSILVYTAELNVTDEPMHSIMGATVFVIAFIMLFIFGLILRRIAR